MAATMKSSDFKLFMWAIVFLFLDIITIIIYTQVVLKKTKVAEPVDIILVSQGRDRATLQQGVWEKNWQSLSHTQFFVIHLHGSNETNQEADIPLSTQATHIQTTYTREKDAFINIANLLPVEKRSQRFIWASDQVIPLQPVSVRLFERDQGSSRFFSGIFPDHRLFNIDESLEECIPCSLFTYERMHQFTNYSQFLHQFISSRHHCYTFVSQTLVLPNISGKGKRILSSDLFQVAHIASNVGNSGSMVTTQLNDVLKSIWRSYL